MIPVEQIDPRALAALKEYLLFEIPQALSQRRPLEERWIKWMKMYRGIPEFQVKEFPFIGASNLVVPLIATNVDTIYSRIMGLLFGPPNLWSCTPLKPEMLDFAPRLQEFLQWAQRAELNAYQSTADFVFDVCLLGTGILKQRYRRENRQVYQFRETAEGAIEDIQTILLHDHPEQNHVSLHDLLLPASGIGIQEAPWASERLNLTWNQLLARSRAGVYANLERLAPYHNGRGTPFDQVLRHLQQNDRFVPSLSDNYEIWETWLDFDISGGIRGPQALVCTLHIPSRTWLRIDYNPFFNQEKPYSIARYMRIPKRFYGIGLAEMNEHFQDGATAMHNQRIDNATLANSTMFKARNNIGIREDEPVFPGRWLLLDNLDDVEPMNMGSRFESTLPNEQMMLSYAERRVGVNDYVTGEFSPAMGYSTATVGVQNLRESNKRFDQVMREIRDALSESGMRIVELYQQYNLHGKEYLAMGEQDGALVQQVLQFPIEMIRASVGIELTATSAAVNKEIEVRTNAIIMQSMSQYYMQAMQMMGVAMNPQVPPAIRMLALQMVHGQNVLIRRTMDAYGIQDINMLVPELRELMDASNPGARPPAGLGREVGTQGIVQRPGMAATAPGMAPMAGFLPPAA